MTDADDRLTAIEAVVAALTRTPALNRQFIVRGSFVNRLWMTPYARPCRDLDLLYLGNDDAARLRLAVTELLRQADGAAVRFDTNGLQVTPIWQDSIAPGLRVVARYRRPGAAGELQIDTAANDPLVAEPVTVSVPAVSLGDALEVRTAAVEIAAAWKLHGLFEHLDGAWQSKTLWDAYLLCRCNRLDDDLLRRAIDTAFDSRLDPPEILRRLLFGDFGQSKTSRRRWPGDLRALGCADPPPLDTVLAWLRAYLTPRLGLNDDASLLSLDEVVHYRAKRLLALNTPAALNKLATLTRRPRQLPRRAYPKVPHLPGSRTGPADRHIDIAKAERLTTRIGRSGDSVVVQEKLDGSCVCAYRRGNVVYALGREGGLAELSANEGRRLWADWVAARQQRFLAVLGDGERLCGEWLALVHSTRYRLSHEPLVVFDLFDAANVALGHEALSERLSAGGFTPPALLHCGGPCPVDTALERLGGGHHGSVEPPEGAVWRLERNGKVLFRAKYVVATKRDGALLPETTGRPALWNWHPTRPAAV